jgi:hypothetical protein
MLFSNNGLSSNEQYLCIKVFVPHVIDGAAGPPHEHGAQAKESQQVGVGQAAGWGRQAEAERTRQEQEPRACTTHNQP